MAMADGNATAMGDCNSNGNGNGNGDSGIVGNGVGDGDGNGDGDSHGKGNHYKEGLPLHVAEMCSILEGRHFASTPMDTKESAFTSAASWG